MTCLSRLITVVLSSLSCTLGASETSRQAYFDLITQCPALTQVPGDAAQGEIEIILDPERMALIEQKTGRDVGIIAQDKYWLWINDACLFPSGQEGVYGRILWRHAPISPPGIAVMPITSEGKVVLNCNFRHATRSWEIELPRGAINPGEDLAAAAQREVHEETGMVVDSLSLLGVIPPDSGVCSTVAPVFLAKVIGKELTHQEDSEAIEEILCLSLNDIKEAFIQGYYPCTLRGQTKKVLFRDPFLAYAILLYELKGSAL